MARPLLAEGQAVAAVGAERRRLPQSGGEGVHRLLAPAGGLEQGAAEVVEPDLAGERRLLGELAVGAGERVGTAVFELQLDEDGSGVAGGEDEYEGEGTDHARTGGREAGWKTRGQAAGVSAFRATRAPSDCNFSSIPS